MKKRTVYPVPGLFIQGVPHVPHECEDPFCTESGAFTTEPPEAAEPEAAPASEPEEA
jgi:hypothetical protein